MIAPFLALAALAGGDLAHSAPWLGHGFDVDLTGLAPGAQVGLVYSPAAAALPTPFGLVEVDLAGAVTLATGTADAVGDLTFAFTLPQAAALAEVEAHLQAYAVDLGSGTVELSNAAHLRLLGSRTYSYEDRWNPALPGYDQRVVVRSSPSMAEVFALDGAAADQWSEVHVSADASVAAVVTTNAIRRFDNFFGSATDEVVLGDVRTAVLDVGGQDLLVYSGPDFFAPGEVWRVPLAVGAPAVPLGIGGNVGPAAFDLAAGHAFVPALPTTTFQAQVRQVDLATGATVGFQIVGPPNHASLDWLRVESGRLFAGSHTDDEFLLADAALGWVDLSGGGAPTFVSLGSNDETVVDGPLAGSGDFLLRAFDWPFTGPVSPINTVGLFDASAPSAPTIVPQAFAAPPDRFTHVAELGADVWIADRCCDSIFGDGVMRLFVLDPFALSMTEVFPAGPASSYDDQAYYAMTGTGDFGGVAVILAPSCPVVSCAGLAFRVRDVVTGSETLVPNGDWSVWWIEGVSIP